MTEYHANVTTTEKRITATVYADGERISSHSYDRGYTSTDFAADDAGRRYGLVRDQTIEGIQLFDIDAIQYRLIEARG